jgi:hypothetical protein
MGKRVRRSRGHFWGRGMERGNIKGKTECSFGLGNAMCAPFQERAARRGETVLVRIGKLGIITLKVPKRPIRHLFVPGTHIPPITSPPLIDPLDLRLRQPEWVCLRIKHIVVQTNELWLRENEVEVLERLRNPEALHHNTLSAIHLPSKTNKQTSQIRLAS